MLRTDCNPSLSVVLEVNGHTLLVLIIDSDIYMFTLHNFIFDFILLSFLREVIFG